MAGARFLGAPMTDTPPKPSAPEADASLSASSAADTFSAEDLAVAWPALSFPERAEGFRMLERGASEDFFGDLDTHEQAQLILSLPEGERRSWMRLLAPDDAADVVQAAPAEARDPLLRLLDEPTRKEVTALMAYAEDDAGGLMNPRYARVRPSMTVDEAISYLRKQTRDRIELLSYVYVLDHGQKLLGVVSFRDLFTAPGNTLVQAIMKVDLVTAHEEMDQEGVSRLFHQHSLMAIPVLNRDGQMKGIVTFDDIVDVVHEEATEDIQKFGGMEALEQPYLKIHILQMIQKRAGWLAALFVGEMLTATAMGFFEGEIAKAVVLALFVPLIISSGGNSGSQASTLVIRAMALGEVAPRDWWRVFRRELAAGLALGLILGAIGFSRVMLWGTLFHTYGDNTMAVGITIALSLVGVVMFGSLAGSTLPFLLRRLDFDPASASAPFVATLVDVTGLIIYFSVASVVMRGTLL
jgi:magnesium transporter